MLDLLCPSATPVNLGQHFPSLVKLGMHTDRLPRRYRAAKFAHVLHCLLRFVEKDILSRQIRLVPYEAALKDGIVH